MSTRPDTHRLGSTPDASVEGWLRDFATAVRTVDYEAGEPMFDPDAIAFGTVGRMMVGRDTLIRDQWRRVWGVTEGFGFDMDTARCESAGDLAWAVATWSSTGRRARDGEKFHREGRASFVLRRDGDRWVALHSHFSMNPRGIGPDQT